MGKQIRHSQKGLEKGRGSGWALCDSNATAFNAICKCRASWARFRRVSSATCPRLCLHKFAKQKGGVGGFPAKPAIRNCRLAHSLNLPTFPVCT